MEISQRLWHINNQDMLKHDHKSAICSIWLFLCVHLIFFSSTSGYLRREDVQLSRRADSLPIHSVNLFLITVFTFPSDALNTDTSKANIKETKPLLPCVAFYHTPPRVLTTQNVELLEKSLLK